ncbi:hypothetical protein V5740_00165 [Croceibacterium sp. TMG7-5b_MA50]|uniref:hypothetical protein n=1 Tax=Croceibacterium sp. TMG7-5b_MA50 TaxID=3121290 RepID=UPI003221D5D4
MMLGTVIGPRVQPLTPLGRWEVLGRPLRALRPGPALAGLLLLLLALVWSGVAMQRFEEVKQARAAEVMKKRKMGRKGDIALYQRINDRLARGQDYYTVALDEQRNNHYPVKPFVTVRMPTLAWSSLLLGPTAWKWLGMGLLAAVALAWATHLRQLASAPERLLVLGVTVAAGWQALMPQIGLKHDVVAGLLLSLGFALYRPQRWWPAWFAVLLAVLVRELAVPFVLVWAAVALLGRRWTELRAVLLLLALCIAAIALHAWNVHAAQLPGDPASPGWSERLGLPLVWGSFADVTLLRYLPAWSAGPLALLALVGWAGIGGRTGLFALAWFGGMSVAVALFARANTFYWVLVMLPGYFVGLALAPRALADWIQAARGRIRRPRHGTLLGA